MFQKIFLFLLIFCINLHLCFAANFYRNESKIETYKNYIEQKAGDIIDKKSLGEKMDLLTKIQTLIEVYDKKVNLNNKENFMNLLYAFQEYIEENISEKVVSEKDKLTITIIDDIRCTDCQTDSIVSQLQDLPFLSAATYIYQDFSDAGVKKYLQDNAIGALPAVIFNTDKLEDNSQITPYLSRLSNSEYSLNIGARFDPFIERSQRGFLVFDLDILEEIKEDAYISGNTDAEITWIEYSDIECPFCAKLHNEGTIQKIKEEFEDDVNIVFQHFPLSFHANAREAAEALECIGSEYGSGTFYDMIDASYENMYSNNFSFSTFYEIAEKKSIDTQAIMNCVEDNTFSSKVDIQTGRGINTFDITGTPGSILINTISGEYTKISGAYPYESFKQSIEDLLR